MEPLEISSGGHHEELVDIVKVKEGAGTSSRTRVCRRSWTRDSSQRKWESTNTRVEEFGGGVRWLFHRRCDPGDLIEDEDAPTGSVLHVHDLSALRRLQTTTESASIDTDKIVGVLERKFAEDKSRECAVWEGGYHCSKYAMVGPLYVVVETLAQLVRASGDYPESMVAFARHQVLTADNMESLYQKLDLGAKFHRKIFQDDLAEEVYPSKA
ncbi:hypothetical protein SELMODRAFT_403329 [Selaginella moellendorffii]|uniref:Uncharacterized protein n=1 Tax=Selaginella moellendorffii TaxID=88036 RepID=D8QTT8_SELML|nr:hypothetical protein SELMODRAFT_403329 [Selaginella moellendorffii]